MFCKLLLRFLFLLVVANASYSASNQDEQWIDCSSHFTQLTKALPPQFFLESLRVISDVSVDDLELRQLIALSQGTEISLQELLNALFYLQHKDWFKQILVHVKQGKRGKCVTIKLEQDLIFQGLRVHAFIVGKEYYKSCYLLDIGERFNKEKHTRSLDKIKEAFFEQGFFNARVQDAIRYQKLLKTVEVDLFLHKGVQFYIGDIDFDLQTLGSHVTDEDIYIVKKELKKLFHRRLFQLKYSKSMLDKSIRSLKQFLNKKGFAQAQISLQEHVNKEKKVVDLKFVISFERKKQFIFWGNHFFSENDFLENILMYGKSSWHFPETILEDEILHMYKEKGFWSASVSVREEKNRVFCLISEGRRAAIKAIEFKDNIHISTEQLQQCFTSFLKARFFDRDLFEQGVQNLKQLYASHGFWNVAVVKENFFSIDQKNGYTCLLTLDEGQRKQLLGIDIVGYPELLKQGPFADIDYAQLPIPFDRTLLHQQRMWLLNYFQGLGHNKVFVDYRFEETALGIVLKWKISLRETSVYFGRTIVEGNAALPFAYLQRELGYKEGQVWNKKQLEDSVQRLKDIGVFEEVYVYPYKQVDFKSYNPVGIKLIAADTYEVRTRIGLQQVGRDLSLHEGFSYKLGTTFIVNNPCKIGDRFLAEADFTRFYGNLSLQYHMPWLFQRPIRSVVKFYNNSYRQPVYVGSKFSLYSALQQGFLFGMREKHNEVDAGLNIGIELLKIKKVDINDFTTAFDYDIELLDKKHPYVFVEPTCMWSRLNSIINPSKGFRSFIACKLMIDFAAKTSFFKVLGEHTFYTPFVKKSVLAVRMRIGHVFNRYFNQISPLDRFYLGGANTVRGYDRDYCPPFGKLTDPIEAERAGLPDEAGGVWAYVPQGGRTMINANFEVRFPVYYDIDGVLFTDIGGLTKDSLADAQDAIVGGSGFGFRYNTPVGPLRFDFAWKWKREYKEFQSSYAWYLTLGHAF